MNTDFQKLSFEQLLLKHHPDTAAWVTMTACIAHGHPPKFPEIAFDEKEPWQQGCPCGERPWV